MVIKRKTSVHQKRRFIKKSPKCIYCNCNNPLFLNIDHKIPLDRGGLDEESNMQTTCMLCNSLKSNMTHDEFKKYIRALNKLKEIGMLQTGMGSLMIILKTSHGLDKIRSMKFIEQINKDNKNLDQLLKKDKPEDE